MQCYTTGYVHIYNASASEIDKLLHMAEAFYGINFDFVGTRDDGQTVVFHSTNGGQTYTLFYYI